MLYPKLSDELAQIRATAQELAASFAQRAARHDQDRSAPLENYAMLKEAGLLGWAVAGEAWTSSARSNWG